MNPNHKELVDQESRKRGEKLLRLQQSPDWSVVVEIFDALSKHWRSNLLRISDEDSIEKIAKDRLRWLYNLNGLETLFAQMTEDMQAALTKEENDDEDPKVPQKEFNQ